MSGKDFLKMLLCLHEYDTNIKIDVEWVDAKGDVVYEIEATNPYTGDVFHSDCNDGIVHAAWSILDYMHNLVTGEYDILEEAEEDGDCPKILDDGHSFNSGYPGKPSLKWCRASAKNLLNDEWRENTMKKWQKETKDKKEWDEFFKPAFDEIDRIDPCKQHCEDVVYMDTIPVPCELHHTMQCPKVKKWSKDYRDIMNARWAEWNKIHPKDDRL